MLIVARAKTPTQTGGLPVRCNNEPQWLPNYQPVICNASENTHIHCCVVTRSEANRVHCCGSKAPWKDTNCPIYDTRLCHATLLFCIIFFVLCRFGSYGSAVDQRLTNISVFIRSSLYLSSYLFPTLTRSPALSLSLTWGTHRHTHKPGKGCGGARPSHAVRHDEICRWPAAGVEP